MCYISKDDGLFVNVPAKQSSLDFPLSYLNVILFGLSRHYYLGKPAYDSSLGHFFSCLLRNVHLPVFFT